MTRTISADAWRRVGEMFHRALDLPDEERAAFAERECAADPDALRELMSLIESDRKAAQGFVADRVKAGVRSFAEESSPERPTRIGPYRLIREIGRGGMGTVYLGRRDDEQYTIEAAVKVVTPGMDTELVLRRFKRERQTLANLQHPNIARLLDGGTSDEGLPYIVMEFVDGPRITEYCRSKHHSIEQRLLVFLDVCAAVEHAHRSFVVHRDLKPGNILVNSTGTPKLLDFGICKLLYSDPALADQTVDQGARMMTPDYASPEQMRGEPATISSDIYSLGAVLYELLAEAKPHRFANYGLREIERVICEEDCVLPSEAVELRAVAKRLRGDLDTIVMRALQKDPSRRYQTVERFAEDIRRHLEHRPVLARADSLLYRVAKFGRRHAGWIAATTAIAASLLAGITVSMHEARIANDRFQQVRRLANTFVFDVHDAVRPLAGSTQARELILKTGVQYLDGLAGSAGSDPEFQSELAASYIKIGELQGDESKANLGDLGSAAANYEKARKLLDSALLRYPKSWQTRRRRFELEAQVGRMLYAHRDRSGAMTALRKAEEDGEQLLRERPGDEDLREKLAVNYEQIGLVYQSTNELKPMLEAMQKCAALLQGAAAAKKAEPGFEYVSANNETQLGLAQTMTGQVAAGMVSMRSAAARLDALSARFPQNVDYAHQAMLTWSHIADTSHDQKNDPGAAVAGEHFVAIARRLHEADPADERAATDYGIALTKASGFQAESDFAARIALLRPAIPLLKKTSAANPKNTLPRIFLAAGEMRIGDAFLKAGDLAAAQQNWKASMDDAVPVIPTGQLGPAELYVMGCLRLGEQAALRHDRPAAEAHAANAWNMGKPDAESAHLRNAGQQRYLTARAYSAVGVIRARLGDTAMAAESLANARQSWLELKPQPTFVLMYQRLLESVEAELAKIDRTHP